MPSITLSDSHITFTFTDTCAPSHSVGKYDTLFIVHGNTFHSEVFQRLAPLAEARALRIRLAPLAEARALRIVCINRREYRGSAPFTEQEIQAINGGSDAERQVFLAQQGVYLGLLVDELVKRLDLPESGRIALIGWSLGNAFVFSIMASIKELPEEAQGRLTSLTRAIIVLDPPSGALGVHPPPGAYLPLWDNDIPPEKRGAAFGTWIASYFQHGDRSTREFSQLANHQIDDTRPPTTSRMSPEVLSSVTDFVPGPKCDNKFSAWPSLERSWKKALFDPATRSAWTNAKTYVVWGDASPWNIQLAVWTLEEYARTTKEEIVWKEMKGINHFPMWDAPEQLIDIFAQCVKD